MSDREKFPAGSVVKRRSESPVWRGVAGKVLYDAGIDRYVLVQWANRSHPGEEDACDLTLLTEPPRDTDSAERSERVGGDQETFPMGARVRERCVPFRSGLVVISYGDPGDVWVRWDGQRSPDPVDLREVEGIAPEPPRAPGIDPTALARLEALERRATPGPWATDHEHTVAGEDETTLLCHVLCGGGWTRVEDADLIVALRNAAPALLRAARAAAGATPAPAD